MLWEVRDNPCVSPETVSVRPVEDSDRDWLRETLTQSGHLRIVSRRRLVALEALTRLKPEMPEVGDCGLPIRHKLEVEVLVST